MWTTHHPITHITWSTTILTSAINAGTRVFDAIGNLAETADRTVNMVNVFVEHEAKAQKVLKQNTTIMRVAKELAPLREELKQDENLSTVHAELMEEWDKL